MFSSVIKKVIPNATTRTFQEVGGVLNPSYFVEGISYSRSIALSITKSIDIYYQDILPFCLPLFSIEINQNTTQN